MMMNCKRNSCSLLSISIVPLTRGLYSVIDSDMNESISAHNWNAVRSRSTFYTQRAVAGSNKTGEYTSIHRTIMGLKRYDKEQVDHRDGNGLNNMRENLRICSAHENSMNRKPNYNKKITKGVGFVKRGRGRWRARIRLNGKLYHLGYFDAEKQAGEAYREASKLLHGAFGRSN